MSDKWIINSARTVGRSHIRENIPCQDSVASQSADGIFVVALSDGCGSAPLSHYGSDITVKAVCDLVLNDFDALYAGDDNEIRKRVIAAIVQRIRGFIKENPNTVSDFNRANPTHYAKFKKNWAGYSQVDNIYPITLFDATVQFVAVKEGKLLAGRLGDGIIGDVRGGALRILSSEDKVGVETNATWYPATVLIASESKQINSWKKFEIIKDANADEYGAFFIVSDGVAEVIVGEDEEAREKFLYPEDINNLLKNSDKLLSILENDYKPQKGIYDDLSIVTMQKPSVSIDSVILRCYDEDGRTVSNDKVHVLTDSYAAQISKDDTDNTAKTVTVPAEKREASVNLLSEKMNRKIESFITDEDERIRFIENTSKILQHLEKVECDKLDNVFQLLSPSVDEDDWRMMQKYFRKFKLFAVDVRKGIILKNEI